MSVAGEFSTVTPRAARTPSAQRPASMPSSVLRTSRRPRATSPGAERDAAASAGVIGVMSTPGSRTAARSRVDSSWGWWRRRRVSRHVLNPLRVSRGKGFHQFVTISPPEGVVPLRARPPRLRGDWPLSWVARIGSARGTSHGRAGAPSGGNELQPEAPPSDEPGNGAGGRMTGEGAEQRRRPGPQRAGS